MPINIGSRRTAYIRGGPTDVYLAEAGTLPARKHFGSIMTLNEMFLLLKRFEWLGSLAASPQIHSTAETIEEITPEGLLIKTQLLSVVEARLSLLELDNILVNTLIQLAEEGTPIDLLWLKQPLDRGEQARWLRAVPFSLGVKITSNFETVDEMNLKVSVRARRLSALLGQFTITW